MRKQYHFRPSDRGLLAWDVDRLVTLSTGLPLIEVSLTQIRELDEPFWFSAEGDIPRCRKVVEHARLIREVDLSFPIILSADGGVMDGMHRVCRALMDEQKTIKAVRFAKDPNQIISDLIRIISPTKPNQAHMIGTCPDAPALIPPMLAKAVRELPEGPEWQYEVKWDGYRIEAVKHGSQVRLFSRRGHDFTKRFAQVADAVSRIESLQCQVRRRSRGSGDDRADPARDPAHRNECGAIPGHRPPLCSTTRLLPLTWGRLSATANHMTKLMTKAGIAKSASGTFSERRGIRQIQSGTTLDRFRLLGILTMLIVTLTAPAQQTPTGPSGIDKQERGKRGAQDDVPTVETQLKVLTEKLDLTGDQQAKIKPILEELRDATQKLVQDKSLSREERLAKVRPQRYKADKLMREVLSDEQKKKLDQYLHGPHGEMHGNLSGATSSPPQPPQH